MKTVPGIGCHKPERGKVNRDGLGKRESPDTTPGFSHTTHLRTEGVEHMINLSQCVSPASHQYWGLAS